LPLCDIVFGFQMLESPLPHIGFADGASRSTQNLTSTAWAIYAPINELITLRGVCPDRATNNIAEYNTIIELLIDVISLDIRHLILQLDS
jgi:ribonuclease HI